MNGRVPAPDALVSVRGLAHLYGSGADRVMALRGLDLELAPGERVAIMGRSGSGKTTLLNILAGLEVPSSGHVAVAGFDLTRRRRQDREAYRRRVVGYVWQRPEAGLLSGLTVLQNVLAPQLGRGGTSHDQLDWALGLLDAVRLSGRLDAHLGQLTTAQTQRLAVAVAMANQPQLILTDELTARLDWATAGELLADVQSLLAQTGTAAIVVTHDPRLERYVDRVVLIRDGVALAARNGLVAAGRRAP